MPTGNDFRSSILRYLCPRKKSSFEKFWWRHCMWFVVWAPPIKISGYAYELEIAWKTFLKTFFLENTCGCVLGPWPWAFLSLASRGSVLGKAVLGLGLEFFCVLGLEPCVLDSTSVKYRAGHPLLEKPLFGKKSSGAAACSYLNQKVAPMSLLAYKTAAAAATLEKYLAKRTMAFKYGTQ